MPRPHPCLAPPPAPIAPHHLSTAPLLPAPPRPHRAHRVPPSASLNVATEQIPRSSPPHHDHRAPPPSYTCCASPSASRPPCADIRVTPPSLSSRCGGPRALAGKNRAVCIPFSPNARKRPPSWQHPPEMHALRDQNGNILAPCIHFRAQSGDSGYMARESCRQGPFSASRSPKSRMARRCCQRRPAFPRQRHAVRRNGPCALRQRHAVRPNGLCALRRGPGLLAACAPLPSCLCPPRPAPPRHLARVHRRRLTRAALRRPRPATRSPYRCISPPAHRTHPASRADPPRPGNKRNSTNNSMRA